MDYLTSLKGFKRINSSGGISNTRFILEKGEYYYEADFTDPYGKTHKVRGTINDFLSNQQPL